MTRFPIRHGIKYLFIICIACMGFIMPTQAQNDGDTLSASKQHNKFYRDILPKPLGYVSDYEHLYTVEQKIFLDSLISDFKKDTRIEIAVITIDTSMTTIDSLDEFAKHIANAWGVGEPETNNGILVAISSGFRRMRIVNGYGIEKILSDSETKEIIDNYFIPKFKTGEYFTGTVDGLGTLMRVLKKKL